MTALFGLVKRSARPRGIYVAIALFGVSGSVLSVGLASYHQRGWALVTLVTIPIALWFRKSPQVAGVAIAAGSMLLRIAYIGLGYSNQIDVSQAAAERAVMGLSPYGVAYTDAMLPGEPFPYGPLALVWWQLGPAVELVAAGLMMGVLIHQRAWITLGLFAAIPFSVYLTTTGANDYSPGLLIAVGLLLLPRRPYFGAAMLAAAAALKPYAFAWVPAAIGFAGLRSGIVLVALSAVLWAPVFAWGLGGLVRSLELARAVHRIPENALNMPSLRFAAIPLAAAGLLARRWEVAVLAGSVVFTTFLFLDAWASLGYWLAVGPITGIALESWGRDRGASDS